MNTWCPRNTCAVIWRRSQLLQTALKPGFRVLGYNNLKTLPQVKASLRLSLSLSLSLPVFLWGYKIMMVIMPGQLHFLSCQYYRMGASLKVQKKRTLNPKS